MKTKKPGSVGHARKPSRRTIEDYYSYAEIALLCRRTYSTIKTLVCRKKIPHIRAKGTHRSERIALVHADQVRVLRRLTLGIE